MRYSIVINDVYKSYVRKKEKVHALNGANLHIQEGKITALLGPNGSGKTTLIKSICKLIEIDKGEILINNIDTSKDDRFMDEIGCILEGERNVYYYLTVYDNLYYFGKLNKIKRSVLQVKIDQVLEQLNLSHKKFSYVSELSRGMQQKVALAILLIKDPKILLLDEPTLGLDVQSSLQLIDYLSYLAKEEGKTILLTTHQLDLAESISDNIILFQDGKVLSQSNKNELMQKYQNELQIKIIFKGDLSVHFTSLVQQIGNFDSEENGVILKNPQTLIEILSLTERFEVEILEVSSMKKNLQDVFLEATGG